MWIHVATLIRVHTHRRLYLCPTGTSLCSATGWRACRRPSSTASRASGMSRSLLARTRSPAHATAHAAPCSAALSQSLALLSCPPFLCTALYLCPTGASICARQRINDAFALAGGFRNTCGCARRADVCAVLCLLHRELLLHGNRLTSLSPTQFSDNTRLEYVAISLSSPAHARPHTQRHMQRPAQQRFPSR